MSGRKLTMRQVARRSAWLAMLVATATPARVSAQAALDGSRPECPHAWPDSIPLDGNREIENGPRVTTARAVRASTFTPSRDIPEFNDCQRILLPDGPVARPDHFGGAATRYGPLMALFMADTLDHQMGAVRASVQLFNYATAFYYPPLGVGPLYNCLYLTGTPGNWRAHMVHHGTTAGCAKLSLPEILSRGYELAVREARPGPFTETTDYPKAARWEWDETNNIQYIGLRCGNRWCQVGRAQRGTIARFRPAAPYIAPPSTATGEDRVRYIPGWHDRQRLGIFVGGRLVPSQVVGTVFPAPDLASYGQPRQFAQFRVVAHIALEAPSLAARGVDYYRRKFNYDVVPRNSPLSQMTHLSLCHGTAASCGIPQSAISAAMASRACVAVVPTPPQGWPTGPVQQGRIIDPNARWWARLVSPATHTTMFRCTTKRANHAGFAGVMPATTRFRWLAKDETTWNYCAMGCCEVGGS